MLAEITVTVALITALGSVVTAIFGWLAKKGVNYVDTKTRLLDEETALFRKDAVKDRIVDTVTTVARATTQTYVDEMRDRNKDGKLSKEEASEAFRRTMDKSLELLKAEGIEVGADVLAVVVESAVAKLKGEKAPTR